MREVICFNRSSFFIMPAIFIYRNKNIFLFAFSTIISWSYYGERCFSFVFGDRNSLIYKLLLLLVIFLGAIATSKNVMEFGDLMILGMAFPNLVGVLLLSGKVKTSLKEYQRKRKKANVF